MLILHFFIFSFLNFICSVKSLNNTKHWIQSCQAYNCLSTLNSCLDCFSETNCKNCISSKPECWICSQEIFEKDHLEIINGQSYPLCDIYSPLQVKVCEIFCRGNYYSTGDCIPYENIQICKCTSNIQHTTPPTSQGNTFNGSIRLRVPVYDGFFRIFSLPNGNLLRGSNGYEVQVWDTNRGHVTRILSSAYEKPAVFGILSNNDLIIGYASNKTFLVWDLSVTDNESIKRIMPTSETFESLLILKNDDLAIGQYGLNYDVVIRDSRTGFLKKRLVGHKKPVNQLIQLPDGNLASCSGDGTTKIWDPTNGILLRNFNHGSSVFSINYLKNGQIVAGLQNKNIEIWNKETGELIRFLSGHNNLICNNDCLQVLENGELISGSYDGLMKIWNPNDGTEKLSINNHRSSIQQMLFTMSGRLITASMSEIYIWS